MGELEFPPEHTSAQVLDDSGVYVLKLLYIEKGSILVQECTDTMLRNLYCIQGRGMLQFNNKRSILFTPDMFIKVPVTNSYSIDGFFGDILALELAIDDDIKKLIRRY